MKNVKFLILFCTITGLVQAQDLNNSPYTRFGLGEVIGTEFTPQIGHGLTSVAGSGRFLNISNPASYSDMYRYNPLFDVGLYSKQSLLRSENDKQFNNFTGLRNFSMGLPILKRWGAAFGLMPYSTSGYDITSSEPFASDSVSYNYQGDGSLNRVFFGTGFDILNIGDSTRLSIGANSSYVFGTLNRKRSIIFDDPSYMHTRVQDRLIVSGFTFDAGMQFDYRFSPKATLKFGSTYSMGGDVSTRTDNYIYNFSYVSTIIESPADTVQYAENLAGTATIPTGFSTGLAIDFNMKFLIGLQYQTYNWAGYRETINGNSSANENMADSYYYKLGATYTPTLDVTLKNKSIWQKSTYNFGIRYGATSIMLNDQQLMDLGMSFGINIPLLSSRSISTLNFAAELGSMGTTEHNLIRDDYFKFYVGFSFSPSNYDKWFRQRKYD